MLRATTLGGGTLAALILLGLQAGTASAQVPPASCRVYGVEQGLHGDSQIFAVNLRAGSDESLGPLQPRGDFEGLAVHPRTGWLHAATGQQGNLRNHLFLVDGHTGDVFPAGSPIGFDQVRGLAFRRDGTLWAWSSAGLIQIDPETGQGTLRFAADRALDAITWSPDGSRLYGVHGQKLFALEGAGSRGCGLASLLRRPE